MHCFKLILCLLLATKVSAETTIITKRKTNNHAALLDKKFVIMQESQALATTSSTPSLTKLSKPRISSVKSSKKIQKTNEPKPVNNNWDDYAEEIELDESLSVGAKLITY